MSLSGKWEGSNGNVDINIVQNGKVVTVNWTESNPYWNYAAGVVAGSTAWMSFASSEGEQLRGEVSPDGYTIAWSNGTSWMRT